jgi:tyrosinase
MYLYGPNSQTTLIEEDDDDGVGNAAKIIRTLSAGTYYVKIRAYSSSGTGTYTIRVTR